MPTLAHVVQPFAGDLFRFVPEFRGKGRVASLLNRQLLRRGADPIVECKMARGHSLRLDLRVPTQMHAYFSGRYDDEMLSALLTYLRPGGVALDVGANTGMYSVPIALAASECQGHLIAFEPVPSNVDWLTYNLKLNQCLSCTTMLPIALSDHPGKTEIILGDDFKTGSSVGNAIIADPDWAPNHSRQTIQTDALDRIKEVSGVRVDVIKVDIEGHEHKFLAGARATLERDRPAILMEVNRPHYERQGLDFDALIPTLLPRDYVPAIWYHDDVLFVPQERLTPRPPSS